MEIAIAVLSPFLLSLIAPWLHRIGREATGWFLSLLPAGLTIYFASFLRPVASGRVFSESFPWVPGLGIDFSFYLDGLSLLFSLLISGIGALVVIYSGGYLSGHRQLGRFYAYILFFMGSMLGLVLADDAITLFVFWELTSLGSYLLIGFDHEREGSRRAALQALLVTSAGGFALLVGLLLLADAGGSAAISEVTARGARIREHPFYFSILILILSGAFTKSAQFPFHFWLPNAMEAPSPVSAYLHSATMVKGGVYLLARLNPALGGTDIWYFLITATGTATMLLGGILALWNTDLKRILAYSTVSVLGGLTLLIGIDTDLSIQAAMLFLLSHALYKGALFLAAGAIDHETGTREISALGGLAGAMPITAAAAAAAGLSMAGFPPALGFIHKELIYAAKLQSPHAAALITGAGFTANVMFVAVAGIVCFRPFFGTKPGIPGNMHEPPASLWVGPLVLAGLGLAGGLFPGMTSALLISPSAGAVRGHPIAADLALWHGFNPVLALSGLTIAAGLAVYFRQEGLRRASRRFGFFMRWGPERWYDLYLAGQNALAHAQTRVLQSGSLSIYLITVLATTIGITGYTFFSRHGWVPPSGWSEVRSYEWLLAFVILASALTVVLSKSRLTAVAAMGVVGFGVAVIFSFFSGPDLAMTQFAIETLTVILFVLVLYRLPRFEKISSLPVRIRDALIALSFGGFITAVLMSATYLPLDSRSAPFYAENSLLLAKGRNIVNVILVDFRALDTMGEITVLAVAGIGVYALLKLRPQSGNSKGEGA